MAQRQTSTCGEGRKDLAYMLLEEARLRCRRLLRDERGFGVDPEQLRDERESGVDPEQLRDERESGADPDRLSLTGLHGDLGTAGYYASAHLEPARRKQLLAQARRRCESADDRFGAVRVLADVTADATRAVERALTATTLRDHMHLAHAYVMSAREALDLMFARRRLKPGHSSRPR